MRRWVWVVLWLAWIGLYVVLSSQLGSSENSAEWLRKLIASVAPALAERLTPELLCVLNYIARKGAHFCGFAILTWLGYQAFSIGFGFACQPALCWAVVTSIVRAILDEYQQSFVPGRTASAVDVLIDTGGILLMAWWIKRRWSRLDAS